MHPRTLKRNGCCSVLQSFHQLLKVVGKNGLEWRAIVRKEHFGETKRLKKLFEQRKMRSRPGYRTDRHLICNPDTLRREKRQFGSKEIQEEVLGRVWSSVEFQLFLGKQSILADQPPLMWQTIECHVLHQGFCR